MVSLWRKFQNLNKRQKQTLYSLTTGLAFFVLLYLITLVVDGKSICLVKNIFGISCPGCGMTRGFISILKFDFATAFEYNLLAIPVFVGILVYFCFAIVDVLYDKKILEKLEMFLSKKYMFLLYVLILIIVCIENNM